MAIAHEKPKHTYEEYRLLPDEPRVELIDGEFLVSPAPRTRHQRISLRIAEKLSSWVKKNRLGEVFISPTDVVLSRHDVVQPDLLFISSQREQIITELNVQGPPDLVVEILSPESEQRDTVAKKSLYQKSGVREYWIVDPSSETVAVFILEGAAYVLRREYRRVESIASPTLPGFRLPLEEIFSPSR